MMNEIKIECNNFEELETKLKRLNYLTFTIAIIILIILVLSIIFLG